MTARTVDSRGFVLVGVIMFVLALTILGMSLFAISGYESSFLGQSRDENVALYEAQGGIDMALQLVERNWLLEDAQQAVGFAGVDSAYATQWQGGVFKVSGPVSDDTVTVTVVASSFGVPRRLVSKFMPQHHESFYKRLLTASDPTPGAVDVKTNWFPFDSAGYTPSKTRLRTLIVSSPDSSAWTSSPTTSWVNSLSWSPPQPVRTTTVPQPEVPAFITAHSAGAFTPLYAANTVTLDQHSGTGIDYYVSPTIPPNADWTIWDPGLTVNVNGTAVWILPSGLKSDHRLLVRKIGSGTATLVIVASPKSPPRPPNLEPELGISMTGGLDVDANVNVLLVTDGKVDLAQYNDYQTHNSALHLSIYCKGIEFMGPWSPVNSQIGYDAHTMNPVIDALTAAGALPGAHSAATGFAFVPGSWRDNTP